MTHVKLFTVVSATGRVLSPHARRASAESIAARVGGTVAEREITTGERVSFTWQGWPKIGTVVEGAGSKIKVRFSLASGPVEKTISVEKISVRAGRS